jgi:hypothetical protein
MNHLFRSLMALGIFVALAGRANAQRSYAFTTLDVPGSLDTVAYGINGSGQIVGYRTPQFHSRRDAPPTRRSEPYGHRYGRQHDQRQCHPAFSQVRLISEFVVMCFTRIRGDTL